MSMIRLVVLVDLMPGFGIRFMTAEYSGMHRFD
jgi:hypothetical protein